MKKINPILGKTLYAILFIALLPYGLILWAKHTEDIVRFPIAEPDWTGWVLAITGGIFILWGMFALKKHGNGLPMNAYPPSKLVGKGPYRIFRHPIYWGFGMFLFGLFILLKSASGFWLVAPVTVLGMTALVWGHEKIDLEKRFNGKKINTVLDFPINNTGVLKNSTRWASLFWVVFILLASNFLMIQSIGHEKPLFGAPLDIFPFLNNPYLLVLGFLFIVFLPFILKQNNLLREWVIAGLIGLFLTIYISVLYPSIGAAFVCSKNELLNTDAGNMILFFVAPLFMVFISLYSIFKQAKKWAPFFGLVVFALSFIHLENSPSAILHFTVSFIVFLIGVNYKPIWRFLQNTAEHIANSWKEWMFGKVRVINHGFYVGFGTFMGILIAGVLAGKSYAWAILVFSITVTVFSALWAQVIEGSEKLKRPYGYYGALVGVIFASLAVWAMGFNVWVIIGVVSVMMPWVQAIGRFRCLVNGCCHGGKVASPQIGIRYFHHRSRVCGISNLKGELLHPTPLYAILWLFFVGFVLLQLWNNHFSPPFIFGLYLILTGIGRFVEEAYRGEVQTPYLGNLRLYQWTAILSVIIGVVMTVVHIEPIALTPEWGWETLAAAVIGGLFITFAMGVDFPYSNARFSRLV